MIAKLRTNLNLVINRSKQDRKLEIGPGPERIEGFETLNVVHGRNVDYTWDAARSLPFRDDSFDLIYASHVFEHIPWYESLTVLQEWVRCLKPEGSLEIWVPDGLKICKAFVDAEISGSDDFKDDGWFKFNETQDPCIWAAGRIFTYGDGKGTLDNPNWHRSLFSERHLTNLFDKAGLVDIRALKKDEVRGYDHKWINMGLTGKKGRK